MRFAQRPLNVSFHRARTHGHRPFPPRRHCWPTSCCARRCPTRHRPVLPARTPTSIRKADMVRAIVYFFVAVVVLGTIATPGLGAFALVAAPALVLWLVWRFALMVVTHGRSIEAIVRTKHSHLLGPGGPDDLFATHDAEEDVRPTETPWRAEAA